MTNQMLRDTAALDMARNDVDLLDVVKYAEAMAPLMAAAHQHLPKGWNWAITVRHGDTSLVYSENNN